MADKLWLRRDPLTGLLLCYGCWNNGEWKHHCTGNGCQCGRRCKDKNCAGYKPISKVKFSGEVQEALPDTGGINV